MSTVTARRWAVGDAVVTRVPEAGFDLVLPQDEATTRLLAKAPWLAPHFVTDEGALRIGSSAIVVESEGRRIVVDPWLAFDGPDRSSPESRARIDRLLGGLEAAGFRADEVDVVANTHIDGVGANTRPGPARGGGPETEPDGEEPSFPRARYVYATKEIEALRAGRRRGAEAIEVLLARGLVELVEPGYRLTGEVTMERAAGHAPGHLAVRIASRGASALITGHLFLHPAQVFAPGPRANLDEDPELAATSRKELLERCAAEGTLLIGPLFADPGGGVVVADAGSWRLKTAP